MVSQLQNQEQPQEQPKEELVSNPRQIPISGRFDQYRSSYWSGAIAALGLRYAARPFLRSHWDNKNAPHFEKHKYSLFAGLIMQGVTGYYALNTWKDIKSIFSEVVAWETGKDIKDVGFRDFLNSKNTIIQQTMHKFVRYNVRRFVVNTSFFLPFLAKPLEKIIPYLKDVHPETGVDIGVAANAGYLFSDILSRRMTPFEGLQALIDKKINHVENFYEAITPNELLDVYERHAANDPNHSFLGLRGTNQWTNAMRIFDRMADLMNQTYKNTVPHEKAKFGFSRFVYLIGTQKIDPFNIDRSLAYIEIANKHGAKAVDEAAKLIEKGSSLDEVFAKFEVSVSATKRDDAPAPDVELPAAPAPAIITEEKPSAFAAQELKKQKSRLLSPETFAAKIDQQKDLPLNPNMAVG